MCTHTGSRFVPRPPLASALNAAHQKHEASLGRLLNSVDAAAKGFQAELRAAAGAARRCATTWCATSPTQCRYFCRCRCWRLFLMPAAAAVAAAVRVRQLAPVPPRYVPLKGHIPPGAHVLLRKALANRCSEEMGRAVQGTQQQLLTIRQGLAFDPVRSGAVLPAAFHPLFYMCVSVTI